MQRWEKCGAGISFVVFLVMWLIVMRGEFFYYV